MGNNIKLLHTCDPRFIYHSDMSLSLITQSKNISVYGNDPHSWPGV